MSGSILDAAVPVGIAAANLIADVYYNEAEKGRTTDFHKKELEKAQALHDYELKYAKEFHAQEVHLSRQSHLMNTFTDLEMHLAQCHADMINATKESERDMFDQNNQQLQTLILSASVMVTALTTLLIQGIIPSGTNYAVTVMFGISCGFSFALLFTTVVLCIETLRIASDFMVRRAKSTGETLRYAQEQIFQTMQTVRKGPPERIAAAAGGGGGAQAPDAAVDGESKYENIPKEKKLTFLFNNIEQRIARYMMQRIELNKNFIGQKGEHQNSFDEFWKNNCDKFHRSAVACFYGGSAFMLSATILWMWSQFIIQYASFYGGLFGIIPIGLSLPVGVYVFLTLQHRRALHKKEDQRQNQEQDAKEAAGDPNANSYEGDEEQDLEAIARLPREIRLNSPHPTSAHQPMRSLSHDSGDVESGRSSSRHRFGSGGRV